MIYKNDIHFCFMKDITEETQAKQKILHQQYLLENAEKLAKIGCWDWNFTNDKLLWTKGLEDMYGIENITIIDEYLTLKKLNLKSKKYSFDDIQNKKEEILYYLNKYINNEKKYLHLSLFYY